jgi:hypothetical protein
MSILMRVMLWALLLCFPVGANAEQQNRSHADQPGSEVEVGAGLICNSEQQVERYLALHGKDQSPEATMAAIQAVNTEARDSNACALLTIAFIRGDEGKSVPAPGGLMKITQIMVLATETPGGWRRTVPTIQFTAIFQELEEV